MILFLVFSLFATCFGCNGKNSFMIKSDTLNGATGCYKSQDNDYYNDNGGRVYLSNDGLVDNYFLSYNIKALNAPAK